MLELELRGSDVLLNEFEDGPKVVQKMLVASGFLPSAFVLQVLHRIRGSAATKGVKPVNVEHNRLVLIAQPGDNGTRMKCYLFAKQDKTVDLNSVMKKMAGEALPEKKAATPTNAPTVNNVQPTTEQKADTTPVGQINTAASKKNWVRLGRSKEGNEQLALIMYELWGKADDACVVRKNDLVQTIADVQQVDPIRVGPAVRAMNKRGLLSRTGKDYRLQVREINDFLTKHGQSPLDSRPVSSAQPQTTAFPLHEKFTKLEKRVHSIVARNETIEASRKRIERLGKLIDVCLSRHERFKALRATEEGKLAELEREGTDDLSISDLATLQRVLEKM